MASSIGNMTGDNMIARLSDLTGHSSGNIAAATDYTLDQDCFCVIEANGKGIGTGSGTSGNTSLYINDIKVNGANVSLTGGGQSINYVGFSMYAGFLKKGTKIKFTQSGSSGGGMTVIMYY